MTDRNQAALGWNLPFPRTRWAVIGFVAGVFTWSFAGGGQQQRRPVDDDNAAVVDDRGAVGALDRTFRNVSQGVQDTTANLRNRITNVQHSAHDMNLSAKVRDRLSREKTLDDDRIEIKIKNDATVVLSGQVPDANDKATAVEIVRETEGVLQVEDRLSVPPNTRVYDVKSDATPPAPSARGTR